MIFRDLSERAVGKMERADLARATEEPASPIEPFEFHGCHCAVASFVGRPPWELHTEGDELLHVLAGTTRLTIHQDGAEVSRELHAGDLAIVPRGCWHNNDAPHGVTLLFMTPKSGNEHSWDAPAR